MIRRAVLLRSLAFGLTTTSLSSQLPESGCLVPELTVLDDTMQAFMGSNGIEAGVLAVMRNGVVVFERGYGWLDSTQTAPLPEDALMRLASVTKPITASAIRKLIFEGSLGLDDHAFDLGQPGGGILGLVPFPSLGDTRLADVTVRHLLDHEGGWDRDIAGDLTFDEVVIAAAMGIASPPGRESTLRYILGQPLQHTPGTVSAYSNIGYLALGMIVEEVSGLNLVDYLHQEILAPLGVHSSDLELGRSLLADRNPREPWYFATGNCQNVFAPAGPLVPCPDGGWDHEARVGQGGLIATTRTLLHFLDRYYVSGPSIGLPRTGTEGSSWRRNHTGSLHGTSTLARQRGDGVNFAVHFNKRAPSSQASYSSRIRSALDAIFDGPLAWPAVPTCKRRERNVPLRPSPSTGPDVVVPRLR